MNLSFSGQSLLALIRSHVLVVSVARFSDYKEKELVICFLKGLNDSYKAMRSQILTMSPLPPVSEVFSMVQQQECPPNGTITIDSTNIIITNTYNGWSQQNS